MQCKETSTLPLALNKTPLPPLPPPTPQLPRPPASPSQSSPGGARRRAATPLPSPLAALHLIRRTESSDSGGPAEKKFAEPAPHEDFFMLMRTFHHGDGEGSIMMIPQPRSFSDSVMRFSILQTKSRARGVLLSDLLWLFHAFSYLKRNQLP